jgi:hypothetical protein
MKEFHFGIQNKLTAIHCSYYYQIFVDHMSTDNVCQQSGKEKQEGLHDENG